MTSLIAHDGSWMATRADFVLVAAREDLITSALEAYPEAMCLTVRGEKFWFAGESVGGVCLTWLRSDGGLMTGLRKVSSLEDAAEALRHRLASMPVRDVLLLGQDAKKIAEELGGVGIEGCEVGIDGAPYALVALALPQGSVVVTPRGLGGTADGLVCIGRESMMVWGEHESQAATVGGMQTTGTVTVGVGNKVWPTKWSPLVTLAVIESSGFEPHEHVREMAGLIDGYLRRANVKSLEPVVESEAKLHEDLQGRKMEAVGQLAAGVAHEINTPVQFIGDSVGFLAETWTAIEQMLELAEQISKAQVAGSEWASRKAELDLDFLLSEVPAALTRAKDGVERVASIVRAMKAFAHPDSEEMRPANLNEGIKNTLIVARNEVKYVARLDTDFAELPSVTCWQGHINQVVLNLVINAAHAVGDVVKGTAETGVVTVTTEKVGEMVRVSVADTGTGIKAQHRDKIWDMFFTTKEVGRGTGHGLAIARKIIEKHGGRIWFESEEGRGTTFLFELPIAGPGREEDNPA